MNGQATTRGGPQGGAPGVVSLGVYRHSVPRLPGGGCGADWQRLLALKSLFLRPAAAASPEAKRPRNQDVPAWNLRVPAWNVQVPPGNLLIPAQNVQVPGENVQVPAWNLLIPKQNLRVPARNAEVSPPTLVHPARNVLIPPWNLEAPSRNVLISRLLKRSPPARQEKAPAEVERCSELLPPPDRFFPLRAGATADPEENLFSIKDIAD